MGKAIKVVLITLLLVLVFFSIVADMPLGRQLQQGLDLGLYIRLASLLGLMIAAFLAWGYRSEVVSSQKYRRADEIMSQAEEAFERKKAVCDKMEKALQAKYDEKTKGIDAQIEAVRKAYRKRLKELTEQNVELKETVGKLMRTLKRERQQRG